MRLARLCAACLGLRALVNAQNVSNTASNDSVRVEEACTTVDTIATLSSLASTDPASPTDASLRTVLSDTSSSTEPVVATSSDSSVRSPPADKTTASTSMTAPWTARVTDSAGQPSSTEVSQTPEASSSGPEPAQETAQQPASESPPPEFLSFNEWREKYANQKAEPPTKRIRKNAQRQKQQIASPDGAAFDGDGADIGSLFADSTTTQIVYEGKSDEGDVVVQLDSEGDIKRATILPVSTDSIAALPSEPSKPAKGDPGSPIQPLPNVGTGQPDDPLLSLRDRSNYALFECAAMVHRSSKESKGASSILVEKKDRYMLTPCEAEQKFVELELCDEIRIDTIVLANFEFFSSMFKHFSIKVSMNYPGRSDEWHDLGTFRARNQRGVQVFHPKPLFGFYRYMRIDFLSHYGSEYYCPVSLLRVYGLTQLDAWRRDEEKAKAIQAALEEQALKQAEEDDEEDVLAIGDSSATVGDVDAEPTVTITTEVTHAENPTSFEDSTTASKTHSMTASSSPATAASSETATVSVANATADSVLDNLATAVVANTSVIASSTRVSASQPPETPADPTTSLISPTSTVSESSQTVAPTSSSITASSSDAPSATAATDGTVSTNSTEQVTNSTIPTSTVRASTTIASREETQSARPVIPPIPAQPPPPVQQGDSIYGTIMKRLTSLEHNQTLSMHYIEAQSSMLREAFSRVERRLGEVEQSRTTNDELVRAALLDLEKQRLDLDREKVLLSSQVKLLTQEVVLERRLGIAQLFGLLALFVFVGFTRGSPSTPLVSFANTAHALRRRSLKRHHTSDGRQAETKRQLTVFEGDRGSTEREDSAGSSSSSLSSAIPPHFNQGKRSFSAIPSPFVRAASPVMRTSSLKGRSASSSKRPRRHYYPVASHASSLPVQSSSRSVRNMPIRHGSAPPEDAAIEAALRSSEDNQVVPQTLPRVRSKRNFVSLGRSNHHNRSASSVQLGPSSSMVRSGSGGSNNHWSDEETLDNSSDEIPSPFATRFPSVNGAGNMKVGGSATGEYEFGIVERPRSAPPTPEGPSSPVAVRAPLEKTPSPPPELSSGHDDKM